MSDDTKQALTIAAKTIHGLTNYIILGLVSVILYFAKDFHQRFEANEKDTANNTKDIAVLKGEFASHEQADGIIFGRIPWTIKFNDNEHKGN